ncbi:MAG TPA: hypothetical protein VJC07_00345 [Candidatus Nanoarchaeia archaeon]|nr:hypothetical protein [Candidatus Nanoarchaeia archaeon]
MLKNDLERQNVNLDNIPLPFFWNRKYATSLNPLLYKTLIQKIKEDALRLKCEKLKNKVDWKSRIVLLKEKFGLGILTKSFLCNYKTIWQWETGSRKPNIKTFIRIIKFCKKNNIKLI